MRVLQVYRDYFTQVPGGIERHVHELAHGLKDRIEVEALISSRPRRHKSWSDDGVRVRVAAELIRVQGIPFSPTLTRHIHRTGADVVHVHSPYPTGEAALLASRSRAARIATYHADLDRGSRLFPLYRRALLRLYSSCSYVLASSEDLVTRSPVLSTVRDRSSDKVRVVPMGVDVDRFRPGPTEASLALRRQLGSPIVLFLGRLRYYKGLPTLIDAMRDVDAKLFIVGGGPMRDRVIAKASTVLGSRFVHARFAPEEELPDIYRAADVFCLPSTSHAETFGLAAVEAMASGVPVITTEVGTGTSTVNVDGVTGFVVPPGDPEALGSSISKLLSDPQAAREMGDAARRRVLANYDRAAMLDHVLGLYRSAVEMESN